MSDLTQLFMAIAASDQHTALALLDATPSLVTGSAEAKAEQEIIIGLLDRASA